MICKNCNTENESGTIYCSCCGADLSKARRKTTKKLTAKELRLVCPNCQTLNEEGAEYCKGCGASFAGKKYPAAPPKPKTSKDFCPNCGSMKESERHCLNCSAEFDNTVNFRVLPKNHTHEPKMVCPNCKTIVDVNEHHCPKCKARFSYTKKKIIIQPEKKVQGLTSRHGTKLLCLHCGNVNAKDATKCQACGRKLTAEGEVRICKNCLTANTLDSRYCENCGSDLTPKKVTQQKGGRGCSVIILIVSISVSLLFAVL